MAPLPHPGLGWLSLSLHDVNGDPDDTSSNGNPSCKAPSDPPVDQNVKLLNPQALVAGPRGYLVSKLDKFMRIVLGVPQTVEGQWVRLEELKKTLYSTPHQHVLADWVLGMIFNMLLSSFVIYK